MAIAKLWAHFLPLVQADCSYTHAFISLASHALLVFHAQPHTLSFSFKLTVTHSETLSVFSTKSQSHTRHPHTQSHTLIHTPHARTDTYMHTHTRTHSHTHTKSLLLSTLCYFLCGLYWLPPFGKLLFTARMVPQIPPLLIFLLGVKVTTSLTASSRTF